MGSFPASLGETPRARALQHDPECAAHCEFGQREFPIGFPEIEINPQVLTRQWFRGTALACWPL